MLTGIAERTGRRALLVLLLPLGALLAGVFLTARDEPAAEVTTTTTPAPLAVSSDAPRYDSLEDLVAASDLIVRGEVTRTARGRVFGGPGSDAAIESRLVTLDVMEVIRGEASGDSLLVEEEGWSSDGAPLIVDGAAPSSTGDRGVWFLTLVDGPEGPAYVVVNAQGRFLVDDDHLRGASGDDPLIAELTTLTADELVEHIAALPG